MKKRMLLLVLAGLICFSGCTAKSPEPESAAAEKPAIYLYPQETEEPREEKPAIYTYPEDAAEITVKLDYTGTLLCTYPEYRDGWHVRATPDGVITDASGCQYNYLFWEGIGGADYDFSRGFVVAGSDTAAFLEEKLQYIGLNDREIDDFITYWLPRMQDSRYNLIAFQDKAYTDTAKLTVTPEPDTMLRVFMAWKPLHRSIEIPEQALKPTEREGFTVVEWGGCQVTDWE